MADVQTGSKLPAATVVTGFETRLGQSVAAALARAGHRVCVIRAGGGEMAEAAPGSGALREAAELPGHERLQHQGILSELSDALAVQRAVHEAEARLGQITGLVHVALPSTVAPAPGSLDLQGFTELVQRGAGAFLELSLGLLPEMFATQTGALCLLTAAPAPGGSFAGLPFGSAALLGAALGAVRQVADRCVGTPLRSFLLYAEEPVSAAEELGPAALGELAAQLAEPGAPPSRSGVVQNGGFAGLSAAAPRGLIELLVPARPPAPSAAELISAPALPPAAAQAAPSSAAAGAAADRVGQKLAQTFRATFGLAPNMDVKGCAVGSVPRWDSLGHLKLMMEVERTLRVRLPAEALAKIQSYRDLEQAVRAHLSSP